MTPADPSGLALGEEAQDLLFRQAHTAYSFTDDPVTEEQVRAIHDLVRYGPTALNAQPLRVLLIRSAAARARLLPWMSRGNQARTATAPLVAVLAADTGFPEHLPTVFPHKPQAAAWFTDAAYREGQARFSATLQAGYFILGVRAAGLAAGPMTGFDADGVDAEFFPDGRWRSIIVVTVGRPGPDAHRERLPRLPYEETVREV